MPAAAPPAGRAATRCEPGAPGCRWSRCPACSWSRCLRIKAHQKAGRDSRRAGEVGARGLRTHDRGRGLHGRWPRGREEGLPACQAATCGQARFAVLVHSCSALSGAGTGWQPARTPAEHVAIPRLQVLFQLRAQQVQRRAAAPVGCHQAGVGAQQRRRAAQLPPVQRAVQRRPAALGVGHVWVGTCLQQHLHQPGMVAPHLGEVRSGCRGCEQRQMHWPTMLQMPCEERACCRRLTASAHRQAQGSHSRGPQPAHNRQGRPTVRAAPHRAGAWKRAIGGRQCDAGSWQGRSQAQATSAHLLTSAATWGAASRLRRGSSELQCLTAASKLSDMGAWQRSGGPKNVCSIRRALCQAPMAAGRALSGPGKWTRPPKAAGCSPRVL